MPQLLVTRDNVVIMNTVICLVFHQCANLNFILQKYDKRVQIIVFITYNRGFVFTCMYLFAYLLAGLLKKLRSDFGGRVRQRPGKNRLIYPGADPGTL